MAEEKVTRKELYARIAEAMANDPEVVELCNKQIEALSRPRKKKVSQENLDLAAAVATHLSNGGDYTNKELVEWINTDTDEENRISSQKMAAIMRHLVGMGTVIKMTGEKPSDPAVYKLANQ